MRLRTHLGLDGRSVPQVPVDFFLLAREIGPALFPLQSCLFLGPQRRFLLLLRATGHVPDWFGPLRLQVAWLLAGERTGTVPVSVGLECDFQGGLGADEFFAGVALQLDLLARVCLGGFGVGLLQFGLGLDFGEVGVVDILVVFGIFGEFAFGGRVVIILGGLGLFIGLEGGRPGLLAGLPGSLVLLEGGVLRQSGFGFHPCLHDLK